MKKLSFFIVLFFTVCHAHVLAAHAVVTDYSLKMHPLQVNQADTVELKFNSKIELGLSQVFLVSKGDKHQLLAIRIGKEQGQLLVSLPALVIGDYALRLKIFAADGHLTEDVIHFSVGKTGLKAQEKPAPTEDRV